MLYPHLSLLTGKLLIIEEYHFPYCKVWFGLVWFGLVWFGLGWVGLGWFGLGVGWVGVKIYPLKKEDCRMIDPITRLWSALSKSSRTSWTRSHTSKFWNINSPLCQFAFHCILEFLSHCFQFFFLFFSQIF